MKRLLLLSALAATLPTGATAASLGQADIVWKLGLLNADAKIHDSVKLNNGDIVIVGSRPTVNRDLWVIRIDQNGNFLWGNTYPKPGAPGDVSPSKVALSPSGNLCIASLVTGNATPNDYWFVSMTLAGVIVADRVVDEFPNDQVGDMEIGPSGNVLFCGHGLSSTQPIVVKMDSVFNTLWTYDFGNPAALGNQSADDIEVTTSGDVLVAGTVNDGVQFDVGLDRITTFGVQVYSKTIGHSTLNDDKANVMEASDGNTYFTYVRSDAVLTSVGRISKFDAAGVFQWNFDEPLLDFTKIAEIPGGDLAFAGSDDNAPYDSKYFRLTNAGAQVWTKTVTTPNLDRNLLDYLAVDPDGTITSLSHVSISGKVGADWLVNSLSSDGAELYQWTFDTGPGNYDIPTGLIPLTNGGVIVHGFMNTFNAEETHIFRLQPVVNLVPDLASVKRGRLNSGNLDSLKSDDNNYYEVCKFVVPNLITPPVNVEFEATVPADYPIGDVNFGHVTKASSPNLSADTELFNWGTGLFENSTTTALGLSEVQTNVDGDPKAHVELGTRRVKARIRVKATGPTATQLWCVRFDKVGWRVTP